LKPFWNDQSLQKSLQTESGLNVECISAGKELGYSRELEALYHRKLEQTCV